MRLSPRAAANVDFILLCWIWGSTWLAIKLGLQSVPPATGAALRFTIAGIVLVAVALAARRIWPSTAGYRAQIAIQGVTLSIDYFLIYWAEQSVPSGLTAVLFAAYPLFTNVIAALVFRMESFTPAKAGALALGLAGLVVIFWSEVVVAAHTPWQGMAAVVAAAVIGAFGTASIKRWGADIPALMIAAPSQLLTGVLLAGLALLIDRGHPIEFTPVAIWSIAYLSLIGSALAFVAYYQLIRLVPATRATLLNYITPIVALVLGGIVAHESVSLRVIAGALLVFASIGLMHVKWGAPVEEASI